MAIAEYAKTGCNVIVDYISYSDDQRKDLEQSLSGLKTLFVGITVDLDEIERRESSRATSPPGHARSHYNSVHEGWNYDLKIDASKLSADQVAQKIKDALDKLN